MHAVAAAPQALLAVDPPAASSHVDAVRRTTVGARGEARYRPQPSSAAVIARWQAGSGPGAPRAASAR